MKYILIFSALLLLAACSASKQVRSSQAEDDMVNFGYGTVSKKLNTMSTSSIKVDEKSTSGYSDLAQYLRGKVAGVTVGRNRDGSLAVFIRGGANSILADNAALIVVDGVPMPDFETANNSVSIYDIKSVDVLKEGTIYGMRGANGVVIITTK